MKFPKREGYRRSVIANVPEGRFLSAVRDGWHFVLDDRGKVIQQIIGTKTDGSPKWGYLVEISETAYKSLQEFEDKKLRFLGSGSEGAGDDIFVPSAIRAYSKRNSCQYPD